MFEFELRDACMDYVWEEKHNEHGGDDEECEGPNDDDKDGRGFEISIRLKCLFDMTEEVVLVVVVRTVGGERPVLLRSDQEDRRGQD